jgi:hypothetical protein
LLEWQLKRLKTYADKVVNNIELSKQEKQEWEELNELFADENIYNQFKNNSLNNI